MTIQPRTLASVIASLVLATACSKSGPAGGGDQPAAPPVAIDVAAVNALVPAELKAKLVFEQRELVEERGRSKPTYTLAAPKGWTQGMKMMARIKPDDGAGLGFGTDLSVGSNCDGSCTPKDWAAVSEKALFAPNRAAAAKVDKDVATKTDHTMIATFSDGRVWVLRAWWSDGDRHYRQCVASLAKELAAAVPAFEQACANVAARDDD
jgi:hypothetical protein